jgi:hypothetical protein
LANGTQFTSQILVNQSSGVVFGLTYGQEYNLLVTAPGFATVIYTFTYNLTYNTNPLKLYLVPLSTTVNLNIFVVNEINNPLNDATVTIERFINNTFTTIGVQLTDSTGLAVFPVDTNFTHRISVTYPNYQSSVSSFNALQLAAAASTGITIQIIPQTSGFVDSSNANVFYSYAPINSTLQPQNVTFSFYATIFNSTSTFDYVSMTLYANSIQSSNLFFNFTTTNATTNNLSALIDTTPYINQTIFAVFTFKKAGNSVFSFAVPYFVVNTNVPGNVQTFQQWLTGSVTLLDRLILYTLLIFIFLVLLPIRNPQLLAIIGILFALALSFIFFGAIGLFVVGIVAFVGIGFIASTGAI